MKVTEEFYVFEHGNMYSKDRYTAEEAVAFNASLTDCHDCVDCINCTGCYKCVECVDSHNCIQCVNCYACVDCMSLDTCSRCVESNASTNSKNLNLDVHVYYNNYAGGLYV